jgi:hypothetical protein
VGIRCHPDWSVVCQPEWASTATRSGQLDPNFLAIKNKQAAAWGSMEFDPFFKWFFRKFLRNGGKIGLFHEI